ncbi:trace amine-associated receptor 1-like [Protopterus annectens]|uniref:trace amine-associated receptor 1-like n=1 Tax=Protopterus annectens TaxID=7888 RepID=UPI001CFB8381|nr:trace amine-associated receptor 1-like [Protopterus annectens]XP_043927025.1 trace amine-associated receptor 1-like [Protopterus annectens]
MNLSLFDFAGDLQFCYEFGNTSCIKSTFPSITRTFMYMFMSGAILFTISGNIIVIIAIAHFRQLHTNTNCLVLSLAVVDFLLGCAVMPYSMLRSVEGCWYFGDLFCKIHTGTDIMLSTASIFHLTFIAIDRYYAVCDPLRYRMKITVGTVMSMIIISWVVPAIFAYALIFLELNIKGAVDIYYQHFTCMGDCTVFFSQGSSVVCSMFSFFIPGFIMLCIYGKIYHVAQQQAKCINNTVNPFQETVKAPNVISEIKERKAAKTLGTVMGVFLTCWSPFFFCTIIDPFLNYSVPPVLIDALVWFGYLNSTFNPLVYAFFYNWFRKSLKIIVSGKIFENGSARSQLFLE